MVPNTAHNVAIAIQWVKSIFCAKGMNFPNKAMIKIHNKPPPIVPSQVFLGDIFEKGVFPINEPTKYAEVSFIQIENKIAHGNNGE